MIPEEQQKNILKMFLGIFYTPLSTQEIINFKKKYPKISNIYYQNTSIELKKLGAYLMLLSSDKHPKIYNAYDLFNNYIGRNEEDRSWLDLTTPVIFLYYPLHTESNKKTNEIISHLISHRNFKNLKTIFLTEVHLFEIKQVIDSINGIKSSNINQTSIEYEVVEQPKNKTKFKSKTKDPFI